MIKFKNTVIIFIFIICSYTSFSQILPSDTVFNKKRFYSVVGIESSLWLGSIVALNYAWYSNYDRVKWHEFNDNGEWLQMDKFGHATTSYYLGKVGFDMFRWSGLSNKKSIIFGGTAGLLYLTSIEMLDGCSSGWGFSWGDMSANTFGAALFVSQQAIWNEQRISLKYSFHSTKYAQYRPNLLGDSPLQQALKDYNGQTYWLSTNIYSFLNKDSKFPKWLNVAVGYGADGMIGAFNNPSSFNGKTMPYFDRNRQYYFSLDVDWTRIPTKSKFLKSLFNVMSFLKFPMPTLQFDPNGTKFYPLYF